jgi:hypothetical protein
MQQPMAPVLGVLALGMIVLALGVVAWLVGSLVGWPFSADLSQTASPRALPALYSQRPVAA